MPKASAMMNATIAQEHLIGSEEERAVHMTASHRLRDRRSSLSIASISGFSIAPSFRSIIVRLIVRKIPVTKEQFIIGRGSKSSDLPIKDGNISRKHAAVILHQGAYYIKDLGSTNGIEFNGRRIEQKRVEEGDVFHICDYELRFTYR
jgi:pSer/pThr/pTyr-binding forkhead associated (FHA) protein